MGLRLLIQIDLPEHIQTGGFDHAAIYSRRDRLYVAHTANNSLDVIDSADDDAEDIHHTIEIPAAGPHGLDLDMQGSRLFCACDAARLIVLNIHTEKVVTDVELSFAENPPSDGFRRPGIVS